MTAAQLRLTVAMLEAIASALDAAEAGDGFDGGDFDGMDPEQFRRARQWVSQEQARRQRSKEAAARWWAERK